MDCETSQPSSPPCTPRLARPLVACALLVAVALLATSTTNAEIKLQAPTSVPAGAPYEVTWTGGGNARDFITLVEVGTAEGKYDHYKYARGNKVELTAPDHPGQYELRYLGAQSPYPTLARMAVEVTAVSATVSAPETVDAGAPLLVTWTGPDNPRDFITVVEEGAPERKYGTYRYTKRGSPAELKAPEDAGRYEVRYLTGQKYLTLASQLVTVTATAASLEAPSSVGAGDVLTVRWNGPDNDGDWVAIARKGTSPREYLSYKRTNAGNPLVLRAPDEIGEYEVRYATAGYKLLVAASFTVTDVSATLTTPAEVPGGELFAFEWTGPGRSGDYVEIAAADADTKARALSYAYTDRGSPGSLRAPLEPGPHQLRYRMGQSGRILATRPIAVAPPRYAPGTLRVVSPAAAPKIGPASYELILDASGSMLKKQGARRRIDIARDVLVGLTGDAIPAGSPFALRVFGHKEKDSCRTDLEIPFGPLDVAAAESKIRGIKAMNLAKTPIADSLARVADDLAGAKGERVVVLITDGEETCGGDPAATIEKLREAGIELRVNIVGFALDDTELKNAFRYWASLGGGRFHDANDAAALEASMKRALMTPFDVLNEAGERVAEGLIDGDALELPGGRYTLRVRREGAKPVVVGVSAGKETVSELMP